MSVCLVTGSAGLIGSEAALYFGRLGMQVIGIDNDMRRYFFGEEASTAWNVARSHDTMGELYEHHLIDVRDRDQIMRLFARFGGEISLIVHTAAQPSHDWAAREPFTDFDINAGGTPNVLEAALPPSCLHLHVYQQGLRRHTQSPPPRQAGEALRDRPRPHLLERHPRGHVH